MFYVGGASLYGRYLHVRANCHSPLLCFYNLIQLIRRTSTEIGKEGAGITFFIIIG